MILISIFVLVGSVLSATICPSCEQSVLQQCPCVRPFGSMDCMSYDPLYMATSIDEAMFSFPNLASYQGSPLFEKQNSPAPAMGAASMSIQASVQSVSDSRQPSAYGPSGGGGLQGDCVTPECLACKLSIVNGFIDNTPNKKNDTLWATKQQLQITPGATEATCMRDIPTTRATPKATTKNPKKAENEKKAKQLINILNSDKRHKRQTTKDTETAKKEQLLGITNQIGCDYKRGAALSDNGQWSGLCNLCWQWRRLPEDFFPNYVNEVSCDSNDSGCLAGFGSCRSVTRVLNVLRNAGTKEIPRWEQATIESAAACECQVQVGTPLHSLVTK